MPCGEAAERLVERRPGTWRTRNRKVVMTSVVRRAAIATRAPGTMKRVVFVRPRPRCSRENLEP